jgi:hypothetical protein
MIHLETATKYYNISITRDLFDDLLVVCDYGSKITRFSYRKNIHVASMAEANKTIDKIIKIRAKHGYLEVGS